MLLYGEPISQRWGDSGDLEWVGPQHPTNQLSWTPCVNSIHASHYMLFTPGVTTTMHKFMWSYTYSNTHTVPDEAPALLDIFSPSSTSLYLSWDPPPVSLQRGILTGYQIVYRNLNISDSIDMTTTTADTSITLENLGKFSVYSVSVSAGTVVGFGPGNETTFRTLNDSKHTYKSCTCIVATQDF